MAAKDSYLTVESAAESLTKEKSSKFYSFVYPVSDERTIAELVEALRKRFYDATHHCFAWRLGPDGERFRTNDDGEPSGTAGRPILGQMLSRQVTDALIVVVRYFGGTKLGVPGLIAAYKEAAASVLDAAVVVERTVDTRLRIAFAYLAMNEVMRAIKEEQPRIEGQEFDNLCTMQLAVRQSRSAQLIDKLEKIGGITIDIES